MLNNEKEQSDQTVEFDRLGTRETVLCCANLETTKVPGGQSTT